MQEEVNEKTISLCIKGGKITAQILKAALIKLLAEMDKKKQRGKGEKNQCRKTGRQSIKSLQKSGAQITNIVVTDNNIKSFDRVARKYGIDYSLKKVEQEGKTEYLVFFKAKDVDVMTAAFKEYTSETLKKQKRESVRQKLEKVKEELSNHRQLKKEKKREQETDTMKNPKKPARLPRKAPSNQTGGTAWGKKLAAEFSRMVQSADMKKLILLNFPYIIAFYMVEKAACSTVIAMVIPWWTADGSFYELWPGYKSVLPSFHTFDLMVGLVGAAALKAVIYFKGKNAKKYRQGEEYGSARWGNQKDIEPFIDPVFENNVILTQTERLMMSGRPKHPKYARNKNVIVIGGSGSGKTRFYVKPNLMQMPQKVSYVLTDPKGTIIVECGKMLSDAGYKIKVLNTIKLQKIHAIQSVPITSAAKRIF